MSRLFLSRLVSRAQSHGASPAGAAREDAAPTETITEASAESRVDTDGDDRAPSTVSNQGAAVVEPARVAVTQDRVDRSLANTGEIAFERAAPAALSTAAEGGRRISVKHGRQAARVHTDRREPSRLTPRVDPVWPRGRAAERLAHTTRTPTAGTPPDTIVRVNIGRVEVKAVRAPANGERTKAESDTKAIGLDEYLASRRGETR